MNDVVDQDQGSVQIVFGKHRRFGVVGYGGAMRGAAYAGNSRTGVGAGQSLNDGILNERAMDDTHDSAVIEDRATDAGTPAAPAGIGADARAAGAAEGGILVEGAIDELGEMRAEDGSAEGGAAAAGAAARTIAAITGVIAADAAGHATGRAHVAAATTATEGATPPSPVEFLPAPPPPPPKPALLPL